MSHRFTHIFLPCRRANTCVVMIWWSRWQNNCLTHWMVKYVFCCIFSQHFRKQICFSVSEHIVLFSFYCMHAVLLLIVWSTVIVTATIYNIYVVNCLKENVVLTIFASSYNYCVQLVYLKQIFLRYTLYRYFILDLMKWNSFLNFLTVILELSHSSLWSFR